MPRGSCHRHGHQFGPCSRSLGQLSRLVEPTLLHLPARGQARYGYGLPDGARNLALTEIDPGVVYRTLQRLGSAGCIHSDGEPGPGRPSRRMHDLTGVGRTHLQDWDTVMERVGSHMVDLAPASREAEGARAVAG